MQRYTRLVLSLIVGGKICMLIFSFGKISLSGTIDMDLITTGISASERMRREQLLTATRNIIMEKMQPGGPSVRTLEVT